MKRILAMIAVAIIAFLGTGAVAYASPPKLTPQQQEQAKCIASKTIEFLKAIDKQTWRDPKARAAAIKAVPDKVKAACPLPQPPAKDVCPNLDGVQTTVPAGYTKNAKGYCVKTTPPPTNDQCPNLTGVQATVPPGYQKDASGNCVAVDQEFTSTLTLSEPGTTTRALTCPAGLFDVSITVTLSPNPPVGDDRVRATINPTGPFGAAHILNVAANPSGTTYTSTATLICGARDIGSQTSNMGDTVGNA